MTRLAGLLLTLLLALSGTAHSDEPLRILIWDEYIAPHVIEAFERRSGRIVEQINYNSEHAILPLLDENVGRIDLMVGAGSSTMAALKHEYRLLKLDADALPNTRTIHRVLHQNSDYLIPYMWGTTGIAWRKDLVRQPPRTWADFVNFAKKNPGKVGVINDGVELLLLARFAQGLDTPFSSVADVDSAAEKARELLEYFTPFESDMTETHPLLTGDILVAQTWNGDAAYLRDNFNNTIEYRITATGCMIWQDTFGIPKDAPNPALAHDFINYINTPRVAARNAEALRFAPSNAMALAHVDIAFLNDPVIHPTFEGLEHCHVYADHPDDIQAAIDAFHEELGWE